MPRHAYTSQDADLWARRVHLGESYRAIAHEAGVDPRTVKLAVDRLRAATERDRWEAVRRTLDAEALRQHTLQVLALAEEARSLVDLNPLVGAGRSLQAGDPDKLAAGKTILIQGEVAGIRLTPELPAARKQLLLRDLWGHEPGLRSALGRWRDNLVRFMDLRTRLTQALQRLDRPQAARDYAAVAQEVLEALCRSPHGVTSGSGAGIDERLLRLQEAEQAVTCYRRLEQDAVAVQDTVDRLVLRGVLSGKCLVFAGDLPTLEAPTKPAPGPGAARRTVRTREPEVSA